MSIELAGTDSTDADSLATTIAEHEPRYSFFRYSFGDSSQEPSPIVFIYTCPSGSKIKERMAYASSRAFAIGIASQEAGIEVAKKVF